MYRYLPIALFAVFLPLSAQQPPPEEGFVSLFNGKDLTGWTYKGSKEKLDGQQKTADGRFVVEDGVIVANEKDKDGKGGIKILETQVRFPREFVLRLQFKAAPKADSGVYVRGPQLQVRDFVRRGEHKQLKQFKNDDWNDLEIVVQNKVTTTLVNGKALTATDDFRAVFRDGRLHEATLNGKPVAVKAVQVRTGAVATCTCNGEWFETMTNIPDNGAIGLQAETGAFAFRNIRIKEIK
jgi:major membrane immunogen (membrane-anchored lipoprotein)